MTTIHDSDFDEDTFDEDSCDPNTEFEPGEDGDFCPFCGAFSPAFGAGCNHHISTAGPDICVSENAEWLIPVRDAYEELAAFIDNYRGGRSFEIFKKEFERTSLLARRIVESARGGEPLVGVLEHIGYAQGSGWSTGGFIGGSGWSVYHPGPEASTALEREVVRICAAFVSGAAEAALTARAQRTLTAIQ